MSGFIDLHAHILPGLDDGPEDISGSLEILEGLQELGFGYVFATPHYRLYSWRKVLPEKVEKGVREVHRAAGERGISITLFPGIEFDFDDALEDGKLRLPGGAHHILVDVGFLGIPGNLATLLGKLRNSGKQVLVVHPERNRELCRSKRVLGEIRKAGVKLLGNLGSLSGMYGTRVRRDAREMLTAGLYWALATDMHSGDQVQWIRGGLKDCMNLAGEKGVEEMLAVNPRQLIEAMEGDR